MKVLNKGHTYVAAVAILAAMPAESYVGPGLGAGTLGVILGLLGSVLIAIFAFFWYPIKRIFRKWTTSSDDLIEDDEEEPETIEDKQ